MKTLQVEVTDEQLALLEMVAGQLPGMSAEKLVGPMALNRLGMFDTSESVVEQILCAWKEFTVEGRIPEGEFDDIYQHGANSRPAESGGAGELPPETASPKVDGADLGDQLAYEVAQSRLESFCDSVEMNGVPENMREGWFDLETTADGPGTRHDVGNAVLWLESRGLLERWSKEEGHIVRLRPLSAKAAAKKGVAA